MNKFTFFRGYDQYDVIDISQQNNQLEYVDNSANLLNTTNTLDNINLKIEELMRHNEKLLTGSLISHFNILYPFKSVWNRFKRFIENL